MLHFFAYRTITVYGQPFQTVLLKIHIERTALQPHNVNTMVWTNPRSLAATSGISIDFYSFRYLDVSVP